MFDKITVYYNETPLHIYKTIADRLGLQAGQQLSDEAFEQVLHENASHWMLLNMPQPTA